MLTDRQISALRAPFPPQALSADTSRGSELTSIKAAYVIERLNEVFGTCGIGWRFVEGSDNWSWPIFAAGGKRVGRGSVPIADARKSAVTDGLTKAASMIGVGHEVFKGHVRVGQTGQGVPERARRSRETQGQVPAVKPRGAALRAPGGLPAPSTLPHAGGWLTNTKTGWIVPR